MMAEPDSWRHMASAPKDGCRILVTIPSPALLSWDLLRLPAAWANL
ncbi:hypothetical protein SS05631_c02330 [Sinorhizobium sp. CCBAU 05631]|nr:hypothetical protein SS05631_c02330 [Sinorhizobium sp. CCBAU 05631]